jgi:hypothetical protein
MFLVSSGRHTTVSRAATEMPVLDLMVNLYQLPVQLCRVMALKATVRAAPFLNAHGMY